MKINDYMPYAYISGNSKIDRIGFSSGFEHRWGYVEILNKSHKVVRGLQSSINQVGCNEIKVEFRSSTNDVLSFAHVSCQSCDDAYKNIKALYKGFLNANRVSR